MIQLTAAMVGMLGGPALQVLVVLTIEREWRSLGFLQDMTNLSEKTVHQAVRKLRTLGYITEQTQQREKYYRLAGTMIQLPFGIVAAFEEPEEEPVGDQPVELTEDDSRKFYGKRLNESMNQSDIDINQDDSLIDADIAVNSTVLPVSPGELKQLGFYGKGLNDLLAIQDLTLHEVKYQVNDAPSLGAALARLRKRQPVPREVDIGEDRSKYVRGEFAAFVQH